MTDKPNLRLIAGGRQQRIVLSGVCVAVASENAPPFPVERTVFEEDTYRVLSAETVILPSQEHPIRLMTQLYEQQPVPPGHVLVTGRRLLAVIYDLDSEPICREEWIALALATVLATTERLGTRTLALPLLGVAHGRMPYARSLSLIYDALHAAAPEHLERLWLIVPERHLAGAEQIVFGWDANRASPRQR